MVETTLLESKCRALFNYSTLCGNLGLVVNIYFGDKHNSNPISRYLQCKAHNYSVCTIGSMPDPCKNTSKRSIEKVSSLPCLFTETESLPLQLGQQFNSDNHFQFEKFLFLNASFKGPCSND